MLFTEQLKVQGTVNSPSYLTRYCYWEIEENSQSVYTCLFSLVVFQQ